MESYQKKSEIKIVEVMANKLNLRNKPSTNSDVITVLNAGTKLEVKSTLNDGWTRVWFSGGEKGLIGFVMSEFIMEV